MSIGAIPFQYYTTVELSELPSLAKLVIGTSGTESFNFENIGSFELANLPILKEIYLVIQYSLRHLPSHSQVVSLVFYE